MNGSIEIVKWLLKTMGGQNNSILSELMFFLNYFPIIQDSRGC